MKQFNLVFDTCTLNEPQLQYLNSEKKNWPISILPTEPECSSVKLGMNLRAKSYCLKEINSQERSPQLKHALFVCGQLSGKIPANNSLFVCGKFSWKDNCE